MMRCGWKKKSQVKPVTFYIFPGFGNLIFVTLITRLYLLKHVTNDDLNCHHEHAFMMNKRCPN